MKVLIIDDYVKKAEDIKEAIEYSYLDEIDVVYVHNLYEALNLLDKDIDLISLDWCFPNDLNESMIIGNGKKVLEELKSKKLYISTIICFLDQAIVDKNIYPFVLGSVLYNGKNLNTSFSKLLSKEYM